MTACLPHPVPAPAARFGARRQHLLVGCAFGAMLAWSAHGDKASAQAFQLNDATPTVAAGSINRTTGTGTETITVNSPTAIINWNRAETNFLPQGNVATFENGAGQTNFVVLNRIFSLDGGAVEFNGTVRSQINGAPGGTLIFQNSGGIIVGATAVFDIGNLVLAVSGINDETGYGDFINDGGGLDFTQGPPFPYDQAIEIRPGAQIRATAEGSYVVLQGPRILQGGNVYVNGTAAYIAGENATFTINAGLFDIEITNGSDGNENPIVHTGTTGGPASTGAADPHRIFMITQPYSSDPVTMLLSGSIGFDNAVSASVENGQIVLSAGFDIVNGQLGDNAKYAESNIYISGGTFTSDVYARATNDVIAESFDGALSFSGDLNVEAFREARLSAINGAVDVGGDVNMRAFGELEFGYGGQPAFGPLGVDVGGGTVEITAENGQTLTIAGDTTLDASGTGEIEDEDGYGTFTAGAGSGGIVRVDASDGAAITFEGDLNMLAFGAGATDSFVPLEGGDGDGGTATLFAGDASIRVQGDLSIDVSGIGSRSTGELGDAGTGFGGFIGINAFNGGIQVDGATAFDARGTGGAIEEAATPSLTGASGFGGTLSMGAGDGGEIRFGTSVNADLRGEGGAGPAGGSANGGGVSINAFSDGAIDLGATFIATVDGLGGAGTQLNGGLGSGGSFQVTPAGGTLSIVRAGTVDISADGIGGNGFQNGGQGNGGFVFLVARATGGAIEFGDTAASVIGLGGDGNVAGGIGDGGTIIAGTELGYGGSPTALSAQAITPGDPASAVFGNLELDADGIGGDGAAGGAGIGGNVTLQAQIGHVAFGGDSRLTALGLGGDGTDTAGGAGTGGTVVVRADSGTTLEGSAGTAVVDVSGVGGDGFAGGAGDGGTIRAGGFGGALTFLGDVTLRSGGAGGNGTLGNGGNGTGGLVDAYARDGGSLGFASATLFADGFGGDGAVGGEGRGGFTDDPTQGLIRGAFLSTIAGTSTDAGTIVGGTAILSSRGTGGDSTAGVGGAGFGGTAQIFGANSSGLAGSIDLASANVDVSAFGGTGGSEVGYGTGGFAGGAATGGALLIAAETRSSSISVDNLGFAANATGGAGGAAVGPNGVGGRGGDATGGQATFGTVSGNAPGAAGGSGAYGPVTGTATAIGGAGGAAGAGPNASAGDGGTGSGGAIVMLTRGGTMQTGAVSLTANGQGGNAGAGLGGDGGIGVGGAVTALFTTRFQTSSAPTATVASLSLIAEGTGGNGSANGAGGEGAGGTVFAGTQETGYGAVGGNVDLGDLVMSADAQGGSGAIGGAGNAGLVTLQAQLIPVVFDTAAITANGTGGASVAPAPNPGLGAGGTVTIASLDATGTLTGGSLTGAANGSGNSQFGNSAGRWQVTVINGRIQMANVQLDAAVSGTSVNGQTSNIDLDTGSFIVTGTGNFFAVGQTEVNATGTGQLSGNTLTFRGTGLEVSHSARTAGRATIDASTFTAQVGTDFVANAGTLIDASTRAVIEPDGTAFIGGLLTAPEIRIRSADIEIAATGLVGDADTDLVELDVIPSFSQSQPAQVVIGGNTEGPGYTLTNAEAGRIRTTALEITAPVTGSAPSRPADLVVRDLSLSPTPSSSGGAVNTLSISLAAGEGGGGGILQVEGALTLTGAGATDGIALSAPGGRVQIINPQGSVRVLGAGGLPGGNLEIAAANIWSASQAIINQLAADPNFAGRNEALLQNDGPVAPRGYIEGGEILLTVGQTLFVQNSGSVAEQAGITVVQNTLTIDPAGTDVDVYAFGRRINPDGTFLINIPYFREVEFGNRNAYLRTAEFNQCVIVSPACGGDGNVPIGNEVIEGPIDEAEESVPPPNPDRQEFVDVSFASESLLEEPVTSGGDSSVWDEDCEPGDEGAACRAASAQPGDGGN